VVLCRMFNRAVATRRVGHAAFFVYTVARQAIDRSDTTVLQRPRLYYKLVARPLGLLRSSMPVSPVIHLFEICN